jgi:hypothetical protein
MSRPGLSKHTGYLQSDPRFPQPQSPAPTGCQTTPKLFDFDPGESDHKKTQRQLRDARKACSTCPLVRDCLKWALVNEDLARVGIWAATTPRQRTMLRERLAERLGPEWIDVLAVREQARRERAAARRLPPDVREARIVRRRPGGEAAPVRADRGRRPCPWPSSAPGSPVVGA